MSLTSLRKGERGSEKENPTDTSQAPASDVDLTDEELLEKARNAANGEKSEHLWCGDIPTYESQSGADMAFCCLLAFWTGGNGQWMDELFRQSELMAQVRQTTLRRRCDLR